MQLVIARGSQLSLSEDGQSLIEIVAPLVEGFDSLREMFADIVRHPLVLSVEQSSSHRQIRHILTQEGLGRRMNVTTTATNRVLLLDYVGIRTRTNDAKLPRPGPGECELTMRNLTTLFGHTEVFLLQRKGRHELPHVKTFREIMVKALRQTD